MPDAGFVVGVCGVIRDAEGRVLLIRTVQAGWELPGGRVEQGEDLLTALVREAREETGCAVRPERLVSVTHRLESPLLLFTFTCVHTGGAAVPGDDSLDAGWFAPEDALRLVTHDAEHARLRDGLFPTAEVAYRWL